MDTNGERVGDQTVLTFKDHLNELKRRSFLVFASFLVGSGIGFLLHKQIEELLQKPLGQTLYYSTPAGGLSFVMQIALGVGFVLTLPLLLYQILQFIRPSLKPVRTRSIILIVLIAILLSIAAIIYVYYISLPASLNFLVSFNSDSVQALINVNDYLRFLLAYIGGAIIAFQLPLFLLFMNKIRRFPPGGLTKMQGPVIIGAIVVAGILTPTVDPINQMLLAGPIILLFEVGVVTIWALNGRARRRLRAPLSATYTPPRLVSSARRAGSIGVAALMPPPAKLTLTTESVTKSHEVPRAQPSRRLIMDVMSPSIS
jgi:sec-independent protein translocase protein TatC